MNDEIYNVEDKYVRKIKIGKFGISEVPNEYLYEDSVSKNNKIFLHTKYKEFLWIKNKKIHIIESEGKIYNVLLCKIITFEELLEISNLTDEQTNKYSIKNDKENIEIVDVIYGRCVHSMHFLDNIYREYLYKYKFKKNDIVAVKSVAGSGKTTTLLELAKINSSKKILYIAFNKSLIIEIKDKIKDRKLNNLYPVTFDALMRNIFMKKTLMHDIDIIDLKPQTLPSLNEWFSNKPYRIKNYYVKIFDQFCNQTKYNDINEFSVKVLGNEKKLLIDLWGKALSYQLITFNSIRKIIEINHWCKDYLDNIYDMIFIDESQDFDNSMLKILLEDTTVPKLFVGDDKQAIYEWKGCINAFDKLPETSLILEFYSTFRFGNPACEDICKKFDHCYMISKSKNDTILEYDIVPTEKYVYLFRCWKNLMQSAVHLDKIWIYNFDSQMEFIKKLHTKLKIHPLNEEEKNEFSDDLPSFLLKLSARELEMMIHNIEKNLVPKEECTIEMYTIHCYKGLEDNIIRIYNDIDIKKEKNLYYVALTRGRKKVILDVKVPIYDKIQKSMTSYFISA